MATAVWTEAVLQIHSPGGSSCSPLCTITVTRSLSPNDPRAFDPQPLPPPHTPFPKSQTRHWVVVTSACSGLMDFNQLQLSLVDL